MKGLGFFNENWKKKKKKKKKMPATEFPWNFNRHSDDYCDSILVEESSSLSMEFNCTTFYMEAESISVWP